MFLSNLRTGELKQYNRWPFLGGIERAGAFFKTPQESGYFIWVYLGAGCQKFLKEDTAERERLVKLVM